MGHERDGSWDVVVSNTRLGDAWLETAKKLLQIQADKIIIIGTVGEVPWIVPAKTNMGNVPNKFPGVAAWAGALDYFGPFLYFN